MIAEDAQLASLDMGFQWPFDRLWPSCCGVLEKGEWDTPMLIMAQTPTGEHWLS
jgi:hypothetical protein